VDKQIPEQAQKLGKSAAFESNALTGQSLNVSHGWSMQ